jgi:orotate phosphoribosyltransferase
MMRLAAAGVAAMEERSKAKTAGGRRRYRERNSTGEQNLQDENSVGDDDTTGGILSHQRIHATVANMNDAKRQRLKTILIEKALTRGHFILASGAESSYYLDVRKVSTDPEGAALIAELFLDELTGAKIAAVGGPVVGAAPIVGALAAMSFQGGRPMPVFLVRKEAKGHGTGRQIEGLFPEGMDVALVEDVVTAGGSVLKAIDAVEAAGSRVTRVLAVVDRGAGGHEALLARGVAFTAIFPVSELLEG